MGHRELKTRMEALLRAEDFQATLSAIRKIPGRQAVNPLFSFLYSGDEILRWRAITAMGVIVGHMADNHMESARIIMRRLMWNLNDESGGIGWGSPEAMGEITAVHEMLATEFHRILISYIDPSGNYLEHEGLQRGAVWGCGPSGPHQASSRQAGRRLFACFFRFIGPISTRHCHLGGGSDSGQRGLRSLVQARMSDHAPLRLYRQLAITRPTVAELVEEATH